MPADNRPLRVVIAEPLEEGGLAVLRDSGIQIASCVGASRSDLLCTLKNANGLIVRSQTKVDRELLRAADNLAVIGRAGVGVDTIDVAAATDAGIVVVNTPAANTLAATEHTFALMLALMRHIPKASQSVSQGLWQRGLYIGNELASKTLGIVGLGRIGVEVATRARAFGMNVLAADPFASAARAEAHQISLVDIDELLERSDIVTLHLPLFAQTHNFIDRTRLARMKKDAVLINCARGGIVDEDALLEALDNARLRGAALDVVREEPPNPASSSARLHKHPKVIATPHLGGSTHEALGRVSVEVALDVVNVLFGRPADGAVNAPAPSGIDAARLRPFVDVAHRMGRILAQLDRGPTFAKFVFMLQGEIAQAESSPLVTAFLSGLLQITTERRVSVVNADAVSRELGIEVDVRRNPETSAYAASLRITTGNRSLVGTSSHNGPRIVEIDGYEIDAIPSGLLLVTRHDDVPGMIGQVGTILGDARINISTMQVSRRAEGGEAMMVLAVDRSGQAGTLDALALIPGMLSVRSLCI